MLEYMKYARRSPDRCGGCTPTRPGTRAQFYVGGYDKQPKGQTMNRKPYCTKNDGECITCSLVSYGRDCRNVPLEDVHPTTRAAAATLLPRPAPDGNDAPPDPEEARRRRETIRAATWGASTTGRGAEITPGTPFNRGEILTKGTI